MKRRYLLIAAVAVLLTPAGCGGGPDREAAQDACEQFLERRVGVETDFDATAVIEERGELAWYVRSRADAGNGVFTYECRVRHNGKSTWTLIDLATDRSVP